MAERQQGQQSQQMNRQQVQQAISEGIEQADPKTLQKVCEALGQSGYLKHGGQSIQPTEGNWNAGADQFNFSQRQQQS